MHIVEPDELDGHGGEQLQFEAAAEDIAKLDPEPEPLRLYPRDAPADENGSTALKGRLNLPVDTTSANSASSSSSSALSEPPSSSSSSGSP